MLCSRSSSVDAAIIHSCVTSTEIPNPRLQIPSKLKAPISKIEHSMFGAWRPPQRICPSADWAFRVRLWSPLPFSKGEEKVRDYRRRRKALVQKLARIQNPFRVE